MVEELYSKRLPLTLKSSDREDRKFPIQVTIELNHSKTVSNKKELVIRLTDEKDLFFLYTLHIGEEDFQHLKSQQGLLVDFSAFPQSLIDLLQLVLQEEHKETPKFIVDLVSSSGSLVTLNVIETNSFKHLTHLALKLSAGTDADVKRYLAACLKSLKDTNSTLHQKFSHTESTLSTELRQAREALSIRTSELEALKKDSCLQHDDLSNKHMLTLNSEREKHLQTLQTNQQRFEQERQIQEQTHQSVVRQLELKMQQTLTENKELTDQKYKDQSLLRELTSKVTSYEEEITRYKNDFAQLRQNNTALDSTHHEQEKQLNQVKIRLAVSEQEVRDKEELLRKTQEMLETEKDQKKRSDDDLARKQRTVGKLEVSIKTMSEELIKGNEIIKKLQTDIRNYHAKLKLRNQVTTEQEKLLGEKNKEMEEIRRDLEQTKSALREKSAEVEKLNESLQKTVEKLEESKQLLKTNENVINWLNKQVTESQLHRNNLGVPVNGAKHVDPLNSYDSRSHMSHNIAARGIPSHSGGINVAHTHSTPLGGVSAPLMQTMGSDIKRVSPSSLPQAHYNPPLPSSNIPIPVAKSTPQDGITRSHKTTPQDGTTRSQNQSHNSSGDSTGLDARYLQRSADPPLHVPIQHTSMHFEPPTSSLQKNIHKGPSPLGLTAPSGRLNPDLILPSTRPTQPSLTNRPLLSTAPAQTDHVNRPSPPLTNVPLASAYFPAKGLQIKGQTVT